jgi:uncharacterized protein (TIGR03435 family)
MRALVLPFLLTLATTNAQSLPQFDVASIKLGGDKLATSPSIAPGHFAWTTQLAYLIGYAHSLDFSRVSKAPATVYVIEATFDPKATETQIRGMLQSLLEDRFKLRSHRATAQVDGYALLPAKGGPKLKPTTDKSMPATIASLLPTVGVVEINASRANMARLVQTLSRSLGTPVWDKTGLQDEYDFRFRYARDANTTDAPWVGTAMQEALGLTLEKQKGPVETLVVDSIESPSAN